MQRFLSKKGITYLNGTIQYGWRLTQPQRPHQWSDLLMIFTLSKKVRRQQYRDPQMRHKNCHTNISAKKSDDMATNWPKTCSNLILCSIKI